MALTYTVTTDGWINASTVFTYSTEEVLELPFSYRVEGEEVYLWIEDIDG